MGGAPVGVIFVSRDYSLSSYCCQRWLTPCESNVDQVKSQWSDAVLKNRDAIINPGSGGWVQKFHAAACLHGLYGPPKPGAMVKSNPTFFTSLVVPKSEHSGLILSVNVGGREPT